MMFSTLPASFGHRLTARENQVPNPESCTIVQMYLKVEYTQTWCSTQMIICKSSVYMSVWRPSADYIGSQRKPVASTPQHNTAHLQQKAQTTICSSCMLYLIPKWCVQTSLWSSSSKTYSTESGWSWLLELNHIHPPTTWSTAHWKELHQEAQNRQGVTHWFRLLGCVQPPAHHLQDLWWCLSWV